MNTKINETMYPTIKSAFLNGQGDVFFEKDSKYICKSRKENLSFYFKNGFTMLKHNEVLEISNKQTEINLIEPKKNIIDNLNNVSTKIVKSVTSCDSYYDEFPDAYGQLL